LIAWCDRDLTVAAIAWRRFAPTLMGVKERCCNLILLSL